VTTPNDPTRSHGPLDAVIAGYLLAVEAGGVPNRQELLDCHPEHADALRAFFADLDRIDRVASPLRLAGGPDATDDAGANGHAASPTVRYFGDYELLEEVARGGMGIVYKARQMSLNRLVALKMILAGSVASSRDNQRFRAEAEAAANLDHPHIVPIYEIGDHEGQQYYSMKFVEGTSLAAHPRGDPRAEVAGLVTVARAVHHAHQQGVLHRDLKPSNVLVDPQGTWFVTDFGLAKRMAGADRSLTESGQILGTPRYMAPDQAAGRKDLTVATDVYSLGVILYERLTGRPPFVGEDALTLLRQVREAEPPRPSSIRPGLDRDLETVVLKCLDKDPARRYPGAEALADDLDRWLAGEPIMARPVTRLERAAKWARRKPTLAAPYTLGLLAVVLGGLAGAAVWQWRAAQRARDAAKSAQAEAERQRDRADLARGQADTRAKAEIDRIHEQTKKGAFIDPQLAQEPTKDQIENGDALNLAVAHLSDPKLGALVSRAAEVPVAASLVAEVPFESASDRVTFILDELRAAVRWPQVFPEQRFAGAKKTFDDLVARMQREDQVDDIWAKTLGEARGFLSDLRATLVAQPLKDAGDQKEAMKFVAAATALVHLMEKPDIRPAISALFKLKDTSLANLLGFLHAFNLRFGVATTPKERDAYHRLFAILDQTRDEVLAEAKLGGPTAGEANPSHVMDSFHNLGQAPSQGPTPPPPAQPRGPQ
jgi:hypothetical protein